jgi:hypothetical protein
MLKAEWNEVSKEDPLKIATFAKASARQSQARMLCELRSFLLRPCGGRYLPGLHPRVALKCPSPDDHTFE